MTFWNWLFGKKKKSPPEPLVLGAKLRCPHGDAPYSILWVDPGGTIDINHVPQATVEDYIALKNIQPFGQCTTGTEGGECRMHIEFKNPWENPEPQGIMVNGKEAITQKSFLMCSNASTPLVIESSGQDHVYVKHLIFQMEMDQKYGEALRAILDDPNGSLYLNKGMYQIALQFLEDQMKTGQGELSLYMLDDKDSAQSFYIRSALAHLQPAVNPKNLGSFCDGLAAVMGRYDASMREGVDGHVLNAAMMNLLRVDCGKTNELIQAGGFYRWQEENKDSLRLMAAWMKEAEYNALIVGSMIASAAKQKNKERYQEKEESGVPEGGSGTLDKVDDVRYRVGEPVPPTEKTLDHYLNPEGYAYEVAEKYGINLKGSGQKITIKYNPKLASAGKSRKLTPTVIEVGPQAFVSEEELANTIAHELNHARDWLKGGNAPDWPTQTHPGAYSAGDSLAEYIRGER